MPTGKIQEISRGRPPDFDDPNDRGGLDVMVKVGLTSIRIYYEGECEVGDKISFDACDVHSATIDTFYDLQGFLEQFGEFSEIPIAAIKNDFLGPDTINWKFNPIQDLNQAHTTYVDAIIDKLQYCINISFEDGVAFLKIPPNLSPHGFDRLYEVGMLHERFRWKLFHESDAIKGKKFSSKTPASVKKRIDGIKDVRAQKLRKLTSRLRERGHYPIHQFATRAALGRYILDDTELSSIANAEMRALDKMLKEIFET